MNTRADDVVRTPTDRPQSSFDPSSEVGSIARAWWLGLQRVPIFWITGMSRLKPGRGKSPWIVSTALAAFWTLILPHAINIAFRGVPMWSTRTPGGTTALWFTSSLSFIILICAGFGWATISRRLFWMDRIFTTTDQGRLERSIRRAYWYQPLGVLAAASLLVVILDRDTGNWMYTPSNIPGWISIVELVLIGGTVLQLAFTLPGFISRILSMNFRDLKFYRLDPSATPGLRVLSDAVALGGTFLLFALVFATVLGYYIKYAGDRLPGYMEACMPWLAGLITIMIVRVALVPTVQLHWIVLRAKTDMLDGINAGLKRLDQLSQLSRWLFSKRIERERLELTDQFATLSRANNLPFRTESVVQFTAAAIGSLIAFALLWAFGNPPDAADILLN